VLNYVAFWNLLFSACSAVCVLCTWMRICQSFSRILYGFEYGRWRRIQTCNIWLQVDILMYGVLNQIMCQIMFCSTNMVLAQRSSMGISFFLLDINKCVWYPELNIWCIVTSYGSWIYCWNNVICSCRTKANTVGVDFFINEMYNMSCVGFISNTFCRERSR
jgi:hypothetical protein